MCADIGTTWTVCCWFAARHPPVVIFLHFRMDNLDSAAVAAAADAAAKAAAADSSPAAA